MTTIEPEMIDRNVFELIGSDWMLITAGAPESYNTMTASWGGMGVLWNRNVCFCVIRPTRYTFQFIEKADVFSLSFFEERYRGALEVCGTKSGRDIDKAAVTGLTPVAGRLAGTTHFEQAKLVIECRKLYTHDIDPSRFLDSNIDNLYPLKDYHRMYIGEVVNCLKK